jgi:hypothetical protein
MRQSLKDQGIVSIACGKTKSWIAKDEKTNRAMIVFAVEDIGEKHTYIFSFDLIEFAMGFKNLCMMNLISVNELSDKDKAKPKFNL